MRYIFKRVVYPCELIEFVIFVSGLFVTYSNRFDVIYFVIIVNIRNAARIYRFDKRCSLISFKVLVGVICCKSVYGTFGKP